MKSVRVRVGNMSHVVESNLLQSVAGVRHGFGTAAELIPVVFQPVWEARPQKTQAHSADVYEVTERGQICGRVDGLHSRVPGIPITVVHADCVPILLARRDGGMVAALHGGWRGVYAGIISNFGERLVALGERASQWVAAVGPSIGPCCYEVDEQLSEHFESRFAHISASVVHPEHRRLDLAAIAVHELRKVGIAQVENLSMCTYCDRTDGAAFRFRSYRRGDRGPQQHSGLMIVS
jgi:YfiH family protein